MDLMKRGEERGKESFLREREREEEKERESENTGRKRTSCV